MGKLTFVEIIGLADEAVAASMAIAEVVQAAKSAASGDSPGGAKLTKRELGKVHAAGDRAIAAVTTLVEAVVSEAGD